jgi:hypothetical protein
MASGRTGAESQASFFSLSLAQQLNAGIRQIQVSIAADHRVAASENLNLKSVFFGEQKKVFYDRKP